MTARPQVSRRRCVLIGALTLSLLALAYLPRLAMARTTTTATTGADASQNTGAMPQGDTAGWHEVFSDGFNESSMSADPKWNTYWGAPGGSDDAWWDPSHDVISDGMLKLESYRDPADESFGAPVGAYVSGGVSSSPSFAQTYGKYLVRFKMDEGSGIGGVLMLWPAGNEWPPEVDFSEDMGASPRDTAYATLHYGSANYQIQKSVPVDLTQWHTLGVEWTAGKLVYTLDGQDWATVVSSTVPDVPMVLDMQTGANNCGSWESCPTSATPSEVDMDINWIVGYAPAS